MCLCWASYLQVFPIWDGNWGVWEQQGRGRVAGKTESVVRVVRLEINRINIPASSAASVNSSQYSWLQSTATTLKTWYEQIAPWLLHLHRNPRNLMGFCYNGHLCKVLYESTSLALHNILWLIKEVLWSYVDVKATYVLDDFSSPLFSFCFSHLSLLNVIVFSSVDMIAAWRKTPILRHALFLRTPSFFCFFIVFLFNIITENCKWN